MAQPTPASVKHRDIGFHDPHPDPQQAQTALLLLADRPGIVRISIPDPAHNRLHIIYDVNHITLQQIETQLSELGFHLDNSLLSNLKRALYYYTEDNEREARSVHDDQDHSTREVFMRCYRCRTHGCRDARPEHWRNYL